MTCQVRSPHASRSRFPGMVAGAGAAVLLCAGLVAHAAVTIASAQAVPRSSPDAVATALGLPVYPGAVAESARSLSLPSDTAGARLELTTAEFHATGGFDELEAWYGRHLSADFRRHDDEYAVPFGADGFDMDVDGVIFARELADRTVGVLLERGDGRVDINLFEARLAR